MSDLWTMLWKEWKDFLWSGGLSDLIRPLLFIAILGDRFTIIVKTALDRP